ncbi:MAG TPA: hypothetical protein VE258_02440, partial [Ktedonobacterales bacterium]|nr:hypothetical protein [Ktedonobacterales bacterium]
MIPDETQAQQAPRAGDANGQVAAAATADHITTYNPATGERLAEIQMDDERAVRAALAVARAA